MPKGIYKHKPLSHKHKNSIKKSLLTFYKIHSYSLQGEKSPHWKGGLYKDKQEYIYIYKPSHPKAIKTKYIKRADFIMEQHLNRYLTKDEIVHHINGIKSDDRPENLILFSNRSKHTKYHMPKGAHRSPTTEFKKGQPSYWKGKKKF